MTYLFSIKTTIEKLQQPMTTRHMGVNGNFMFSMFLKLKHFKNTYKNKLSLTKIHTQGHSPTSIHLFSCMRIILPTTRYT